MENPDIRLGGQLNMFPSISRLFLRWRGTKLGGGFFLLSELCSFMCLLLTGAGNALCEILEGLFSK